MSEFPESMDQKTFLTLLSYIAEAVSDDVIVSYFSKSIRRYQKAKLKGESEENLKSIFQEITLLSYINMLRQLDTPAEELIKDIDNMTRVLDLVRPKKN